MIVGCAFIYSARRVFDENDSVSPAITQRMTNPHQYQVVNSSFKNALLIGARSAFAVGSRDTANARSDGVRYGALVVVGVSGNRNNPYIAIGRVIKPSIWIS